MPERPSTVRVDASSIQGKGAYLIWKRLTWGERKANYEPIELLIAHIVDWNWVDGDGNPLPLPKSQEDFEALYDEEIVFLADVGKKALQGRLEFTLEVEKN